MSKVFIIAEAGINHNGKINNAFKLVQIAYKAKVDAIKFQLFTTKNFINKNKNLKGFKRFKGLEFSIYEWKRIVSFAKKKKIKIFFSVFDKESLELLKKLKCRIIKIPSGEINNYDLLKKINQLKKKVILSTGMSTLKEIKKALKYLNKCEVKILHCVSEYPTPTYKANLSLIRKLRSELKVEVGLSDHSRSTLIPALAISFGATIIEKHITFNRNQKFGDHKMSVTQKELTEMTNYIREAELVSGNGKKKLSYKEKKLAKVARKGAYLGKDILKGEKLEMRHVKFLRPSNNSKYEIITRLIGKKSKKNLSILSDIKKNDFK